MRNLSTLVLPCLAALVPAQTAPKVEPTWMDLAVGTDLTWTAESADKGGDAGGGSSETSSRHEIRIVCLGVAADGKLRLVLVDEALPREADDVPIVNTEIGQLEPRTGELSGETAAEGTSAASRWSPLLGFPYPPLSPAEWQAKKPLTKQVASAVAGEPMRLPLKLTFTKAKRGKQQAPLVVGEIEAAKPLSIELVGIAGMVAMLEGHMPKLGASGIEPVPATLTRLRREYQFDAKGRLLEVHTESAFEAAGGKLKIVGQQTLRETQRRQLKPAELATVTTMLEAIHAITHASDAKAARRERAVALQADAKKLGFGPMVDRLVDSLTRDGLPPGLPR